MTQAEIDSIIDELIEAKEKLSEAEARIAWLTGFEMVPPAGLEPTRLATRAPKTRVSTYSTKGAARLPVAGAFDPLSTGHGSSTSTAQ